MRFRSAIIFCFFVLAAVPILRGSSVERSRLTPDEPLASNENTRIPDLRARDYDREESRTVRKNDRTKRHQRVPIEHQVGDTLTFNVRNLLLIGWIKRTFVLAAKETAFDLWIEKAEVDNGNVTESDITNLVDVLGNRTPEGSVDPGSGVFQNVVNMVGQPIDYDQNGVVTILWYDIIDDFEIDDDIEPFDFIPSYIDFQDSNPDAPANVGNQADVIYLDTDPLLIHPDLGINDVAKAVAFELTRLVHLRTDRDEIPFTVIGISSAVSALNGFQAGPISYTAWTDLRYAEHNLPLLRYENDYTDVQRGQLFHLYLAEQLGTEVLRSIIENPENAVAGYTQALTQSASNRNLSDLLLDFHSTIYATGKAEQRRFNFQHPSLHSIPFAPDNRIEGSWQTASTDTFEISPGGAVFLQWENVTDFSFSFSSVSDPSGDNPAARLFFESFDGSVSYRDYDNMEDQITAEGQFEFVTAVIANTDLLSNSLETSVEASWRGTVVPELFVKYDDGVTKTDSYFNLAPGSEGRVASRFDIPEDGILTRVHLANLYTNQFLSPGGQILRPPSETRDFRLTIWDDNGSGMPGDVVFSKEILDPRPFQFATVAPPFLTIDLASEANTLSALSGTVFIGYAENGSDLNYTVVAVSESVGDNQSFVFNNGQWLPLSVIVLDGTTSLANTILLIRATFLLPGGPVAKEPVNPLPEFSKLGIIYPNPFDSELTIPYTLSQPADVTFDVFDITGRRITRKYLPAVQAGNHLEFMNGSDWAAGVYFVRITTGNFTRSKLITKIR